MDTKAQQLRYLAAFYGKTTIDELMKNFQKNLFSSLNQYECEKKLKLVKSLVIKEGSPLDVLCIVAAGKKTTEGTKSIPANDTMLECVTQYNIFKNSLDLSMKSATSCVAVGCSPFFIKKWSLDEELKGYPVTFVVENKDEKDVLNAYFQNSRYSGANRKEIEVKSIFDFVSEVKEEKELKYRNILIRASGISERNRKCLRDLFIDFYAHRQRLFYFGSDEDMVKFAGEIGSRDIAIKEACLIPSGLADVTIPKYKTLWECESKPEVITKVIKVYRAINVNKRGDIQSISIRDVNPILIDMDRLIATGNSLRKEYERVESSKDSRSKRAPAQRVYFSPEIVIWYNVSSKHEKTRAEAYIYKSSIDSKVNGENATRRNRIEESRKHTGRIKKDEVLSWIKFTYPFSISSKKNNSKAVTTINIRDVIASEYKGRYENQSGDDFLNISFRTAWYIFPEIGEQLSPNEIQLLHNIAMGPLGELNIVDTTADEYADALENDDELSRNKRALNLISILLDFAVRKNLCRQNVIDEAITNDNFSRKQFKIIRRNLTKKSLTKEQFLQLISKIKSELDNNNWKYLGVLIRLCTGLQGNIVSALTWDDYEHVIDYDFYCFHIYRQVVNDGTDYKLFSSIEQSRCVPVCSLLNEYLGIKLARDKDMYPESYRNQLIINLESDGLNKKNVTPIELARICKDAIFCLGIKEDLISVPDSAKGTIDTDISRYAGDLFRSNYIYWCTRADLTADEISYLVGNQAVTTIGKHYVDYLCDDLQFSLFVKQERIFTMILENNETSVERSNDKRRIGIKVKGPFCTRISVESICKSNHGSNVEIESKYGFALKVEQVKGEG